MAAAVKAIPDMYPGVTAYLIVKGGTKALDFYQRAFGAQELFRLPMPDGKIGHAEIKIGQGVVMLADEAPEYMAKSPESYGGTPVSLMFYVDDVDQAFERAIAAGGTVTRPVKDQFYGDRSGTLTDPFGHVWTIATHKEDLSPEELQKRLGEAH
jgi:PhnB protein